MSKDENLRDELLRQNGLSSHPISEEDRDALRQILKRDKARVRRMKWAAGIAWALFLGPFVAQFLEVKLQTRHTLAVIQSILSGLAIVFTISLLIRAWIARNREYQFHLAEIEARLQSIEELLKRPPTKDPE